MVIHRRDSFRSEKILADKLKEKAENGNVNIRWFHVLEEVLGDETGVTGIRIRNVQTDEVEDVALDGVFVAIGHSPNTGMFEGQLDMQNGYITEIGRASCRERV